jgi:putative hydrolase of the HAD superfamily
VLEFLRPRVLLFDFYGTLVDFETDEHDESRHSAWEVVALFLRYRGSSASPEVLREKYFHYVEEALTGSAQRHADVDVIPIFQRLMDEAGVSGNDGLAITVAQLFRSCSIKRFDLFHETRSVIEALSKKFILGLVSDSQEPYLIPELRQASLDVFFKTVVMSSCYGYRKPDPRLMLTALKQLGVEPGEAIYVGDSWMRDVEGAQAAGIHPVWVRREKRVIEPPPHDFSVDTIRDLTDLLRLGSPA